MPDYYPLMESTGWVWSVPLPRWGVGAVFTFVWVWFYYHRDQSSQGHYESSKLPLVIKEKDVEYQVGAVPTVYGCGLTLPIPPPPPQLHRMILFTRLLESYPYMRHMVVKEAMTDVCPLVRAEVWAALLEVKVRYVRADV